MFRWRAVLALLPLLLAARGALAVPSFARQTGMACEACNTVFPELTHFGRLFKANGYILDNVKQVQDISAKKEQLLELSGIPPLSVMLQVSYSQLRKPLPDLSNVSIPGEAQNGTAGFPQQFSLFYAGTVHRATVRSRSFRAWRPRIPTTWARNCARSGVRPAAIRMPSATCGAWRRH